MTTTSTVSQVIGKCSNGHTVRGECRMGLIVATTEGATTDRYRNLVCGCGAAAGVRFMNVTVVAEKACNGLCMAATGPSCSCSCGGENHGKNHTYETGE